MGYIFHVLADSNKSLLLSQQIPKTKESSISEYFITYPLHSLESLWYLILYIYVYTSIMDISPIHVNPFISSHRFFCRCFCLPGQNWMAMWWRNCRARPGGVLRKMIGFDGSPSGKLSQFAMERSTIFHRYPHLIVGLKVNMSSKLT